MSEDELIPAGFFENIQFNNLLWRAQEGDGQSARLILAKCAELLERDGCIEDNETLEFLIKFLNKIGEGDTLAKSLGSKKRNKLQNLAKNKAIADDVDTSRLLGAKKETAISDVAKSHHLSEERISSIYYENRKNSESRSLSHSMKLGFFIYRLMRDEKLSYKNAAKEILSREHPKYSKAIHAIVYRQLNSLLEEDKKRL